MPNPLPADLPENWTLNQIVSPTGTDVGLTEKHGYNYQAKQINDAQRAINDNTAAIDTKATKAVPAAAGNLASLAADGDLQDSGVQAGDFVSKTATAAQEMAGALLVPSLGVRSLKSTTNQFLGGGIVLQKPTDSALTGDVAIDISGSTLRFRESGGNPRVGYLDVTECDTNPGSEFWHSGNFPVEQGTFTPYIAGTVDAGAFTYSAQYGTYYRIGKLVKFYAQLIITAIGTPPTGFFALRGFPFVPVTAEYYHPIHILSMSLINGKTYNSGFVFNQNAGYVYSQDGSGAWISINGITATFSITFCGEYLIA